MEHRAAGNKGRKMKTFNPTGDYSLQPNDLVYGEGSSEGEMCFN